MEYIHSSCNNYWNIVADRARIANDDKTEAIIIYCEA